MINYLIVIIIFTIFIHMFGNKESFDLTTNMEQIAWDGRFNNRYYIGSSPVTSLQQCKDRCNQMEICKGISYKPPKPCSGCNPLTTLSHIRYTKPECRLYHQSTSAVPDPNYKSWRLFANHIY